MKPCSDLCTGGGKVIYDGEIVENIIGRWRSCLRIILPSTGTSQTIMNQRGTYSCCSRLVVILRLTLNMNEFAANGRNNFF